MSNQQTTKAPQRGPAFGPGSHGMMKGEKAKNFKGTIFRLLDYMEKYKIAVVFVGVFAVLSTIFSIAGPKIMGEATNILFNGIKEKVTGQGGIDFAAIGAILAFVLGLYIVSAIFSWIMGIIMTNVSVDITYRLRKDLSEKMNRLPLNYYDKTTHGQVLSRITNDVETVNQTLSQSLTQIITSVVSVLGVLVMMITIDWRMTLVALLVLPLSFGVVGFIIGKSQKYFKQQQAALGAANGHIEEMYSGHTVMKVFNGEAQSVAVLDKHNAVLHESSWKSNFLSGLMMPLMMVIGNIGYVLIAILGGWFAVNNVIMVGDIQAFIQYMRSFTQPISQIANISNILQQTAAAAERVFEFLDETEEVKENSASVKPAVIKGEVEFKNIHFGYDPEKTIINDFSTLVEPGKKIAIVGPTGAGKTTIVKLLMRFYDVNSGVIHLDGHDIRDFTREDLRKCFAMVLQDTWLYNGTVMENIRYGRPDASDEEVKNAAKAAHADHFIHTLPEGYNMVLNEESSNISQGQKQLLTIARAVLADPRILILDEATSSVDTRTEILIQKAMDSLMHGRTSFIIAHRLSTIRNADHILVMKDGDIVEQGSHDALMQKGGFYADLYNSQFDSPAA